LPDAVALGIGLALVLAVARGADARSSVLPHAAASDPISQARRDTRTTPSLNAPRLAALPRAGPEGSAETTEVDVVLGLTPFDE
jgi:hypothetical protein